MLTTRERNLDLPKECDSIIARAQEGLNAIVIMGPLLFLASSDGDAYVLDIEDKFACELCIEGKKQAYPLIDAGTRWLFNWPWRYSHLKGHISFERTDGGDSSRLPRLVGGTLGRKIAQYNRKAGTNYHL